MDSREIKLLKAKLKTAKAEERQWAKAYNRADKALWRLSAKIDKLEAKLELARIKQEAAASR